MSKEIIEVQDDGEAKVVVCECCVKQQVEILELTKMLEESQVDVINLNQIRLILEQHIEDHEGGME